MKNIHEFLHQKESELAKVAKELDALRTVVPLLLDDEDQVEDPGEQVLHLDLASDRRLSNGSDALDNTTLSIRPDLQGSGSPGLSRRGFIAHRRLGLPDVFFLGVSI